jgi:hypothetical protein
LDDEISFVFGWAGAAGPGPLLPKRRCAEFGSLAMDRREWKRSRVKVQTKNLRLEKLTHEM